MSQIVVLTPYGVTIGGIFLAGILGAGAGAYQFTSVPTNDANNHNIVAATERLNLDKQALANVKVIEQTALETPVLFPNRAAIEATYAKANANVNSDEATLQTQTQIGAAEADAYKRDRAPGELAVGIGLGLVVATSVTSLFTLHKLTRVESSSLMEY